MEVEHLAARYNEQADKFEVAMKVTRDDGTTFMQLHVFPPETMEWRAAEYGIDPTDTDTLLDIVLTEPFAEEEPPLWKSKNRDEARSLLLEQVRGRKERLKPAQRRGEKTRADELRDAGIPEEYVAAAEEEPMAFLKRAARVNPAVVAVMAKDVEKQREKIKEEKATVARAASSAPVVAVPKEDPRRAIAWDRRLNLSRREE